MRQLLRAAGLAALAAAGACHAALGEELRVNTANGVRTAIVRPAEQARAPTVIVLHGALISAEYTVSWYGFDEAARQHGFAAVFPRGVALQWNDGRDAWMSGVDIQGARARIDSYPHEFSGGMRQRVVLALALCAEPDLLIADEPTTALDVSIQAQIIALLKRLCRERGTAVMLITHDMGVIAETADRVAVMYAGRIAEIGPVREVVQTPHHPYTKGLMGAIPTVATHGERLVQIPGSMPRLTAIPAGCAFHPRCPHAFDRCRSERPERMPAGTSEAACWLVAETAGAGA